MTCYMRHMDWLFEALELENNKENRKRLDVALRRVLGSAETDHCPQVWAAIKGLEPETRAGLPDLVRQDLQ